MFATLAWEEKEKLHASSDWAKSPHLITKRLNSPVSLHEGACVALSLVCILEL